MARFLVAFAVEVLVVLVLVVGMAWRYQIVDKGRICVSEVAVVTLVCLRLQQLRHRPTGMQATVARMGRQYIVDGNFLRAARVVVGDTGAEAVRHASLVESDKVSWNTADPGLACYPFGGEGG
jgi:hypothetical protein